MEMNDEHFEEAEATDFGIIVLLMLMALLTMVSMTGWISLIWSAY